MIKICVSGLGRAGRQIAKYILDSKDAKLVSVCCGPDSPKLGKDLGEVLNVRDTGIIVDSVDHFESGLFRAFPDVVIDFSTPDAALRNAEIFSKLNINIVMGTTGFSEEQEKQLFSIVRKYKNGLIYAPNITKGINIMMFLTELASRLLGNYDAEIIEMHHKHKKDRPSGTALKISNCIKNNSLIKAEESDIPISAVRAGGIVGYHKVILAGENDKLEISHESFSRDAFAEGALFAARFIYQKTGLFEMRDAFNLEDLLYDYFSERLGDQDVALG